MSGVSRVDFVFCWAFRLTSHIEGTDWVIERDIILNSLQSTELYRSVYVYDEWCKCAHAFLAPQPVFSVFSAA